MKKTLLSLFALACTASAVYAAPAKAYAANASTIDCPYETLRIVAYSTDVYFEVVTTDNRYAFSFDLNHPASVLDYNVTYTMDDILSLYSYGYDYVANTYIYFEELAVTLIESNGETLLEATVKDTNANEYHIYSTSAGTPGDEPAEYTEVETGEFTSVTLSTYFEYDGTFQFTMKNDIYWVYLSLVNYNSEIAGTYTLEDVDVLNYYTALVENGTQILLNDVEATITQVGEDAYVIDAKLYANNGNVYLVNAHYNDNTTGIEAVETIKAVKAYNLQGQAVKNADAAGFYIQNGKKVMMK